MEARWLDKAERKLGWLAVPGLALMLAVMNGLVAVLSTIKPEFPYILSLDPQALRDGQVWRALTCMFVPPPSPALWLILWLLVFYAFSSRLERAWGDFKFTVYCLLGALGLTAGCLLADRPLTNSLFQTGLFLAFARLDPDYEVLIFFVIPARMRWLWYITAAGLAFQFVFTDWGYRAVIVLALANYLLFFGRRALP